MATCPLCNAQVSDDFGLIECPSCAAQLLVHMDGRVEYSGGQELVDESEPVDDKTTATNPEENFEFGEPLAEIEMPPEIPGEMDATVVHQDLMHEDDFTAEEKRVQEKRAQSTASQAAEIHDLGDSDTVLSTPSDHAPPPNVDSFEIIPEEPAAEVYKPRQDSPDLSDIAGFGNTDNASTRDGSLRYNLIITGIDTADVRESFREAITDRKLVWDIDQILRSLKNGEVHIQNVPPPKAYILISRLRNLPVQVRWEQYAISQT